MTTKRLLLVTGLFSISTFACGGDQNKQANDAHDAQLESERKQQQQAADDRSDTKVKAAEDRRDNTEANATGSSATRDRTSADAKFTETKDVYRAKATERLEKLDARTAELKARVSKAGPKATTSARDALSTVDTQRGMVKHDLDQLAKVGNDDWQSAKTNLDAHLDTLDGLVKKAASEVEKF